MSRLTRDGTAEPVSRDQILRRERGQGNIHFPCSADHEQDWQPYPVDPYSCYMCDHTIKTCKNSGPASVLGTGCFDYRVASLCVSGTQSNSIIDNHKNEATVSKPHIHA